MNEQKQCNIPEFKDKEKITDEELEEYAHAYTEQQNAKLRKKKKARLKPSPKAKKPFKRRLREFKDKQKQK